MQCEKCGCERLIIVDEDSRQEWYEITYACPDCGYEFCRKQEFDQKGLVISDKIITE